MAHISRPFQIALAAAVAALGVFAVWSVALHHPGSGPSAGSGSPSSPVAASAPARSAGSDGSPAAPTPVYHGSAPGVEGLSRAIERAHGAVATSEQNAKQLGEKSAQASQEAPPSTSSAPAPTSAPATAAPTAAVHKIAPHKPLAHKPVVVHVNPALLAAALQAAQQAQLKQELAQGKTVLLLFWNPRSTDDVEVRKQVQAVAAHQKGKVAAHVALADQVGQYGSVTRDVQIFQTPTLLIVGKQGLAVTLTGLVDQYAIEQGILEAKKLEAGKP